MLKKAAIPNLNYSEWVEMLEKIVNDVCVLFNITQAQLTSKVRKAEYVRARMVVAYIANNMFYTDSEIAERLKKDRTTVIYYVSELPGVLPIWSAKERIKIKQLIDKYEGKYSGKPK